MALGRVNDWDASDCACFLCCCCGDGGWLALVDVVVSATPSQCCGGKVSRGCRTGRNFSGVDLMRVILRPIDCHG